MAQLCCSFPPPHSNQGFWVLLLLSKHTPESHRQTEALSTVLSLQIQCSPHCKLHNLHFKSTVRAKILRAVIERAAFLFWCCVSLQSDPNPTAITLCCCTGDLYLLTFRGAAEQPHILSLPNSAVLLQYSMLLPSKASNK